MKSSFLCPWYPTVANVLQETSTLIQCYNLYTMLKLLVSMATKMPAQSRGLFDKSLDCQTRNKSGSRRMGREKDNNNNNNNNNNR